MPGHGEGPRLEDRCCIPTTIIFRFIAIVTLTFTYCSLREPYHSKRFTSINSLDLQQCHEQALYVPLFA